MVTNLPASSGDTGSIPGLGRFHMSQGNQAHVPQLLKPTHPKAHALQQEKPPQCEAQAPQRECSACLLQLEMSPGAAAKTRHSQR